MEIHVISWAMTRRMEWQRVAIWRDGGLSRFEHRKRSKRGTGEWDPATENQFMAIFNMVRKNGGEWN